MSRRPATLRREERRFHDDLHDQRLEFQRDRDRLLYTSALRRLGGVTQVISADEGHVFHNRLTHTLEVAQVARRLAEKMNAKQPEVAEALGGVNEDVAETAALGHDLGHPPFGHVGEEELAGLAKARLPDPFEGNAQSFRIVTKLACRYLDEPGLDLTRATLNAILKYPWLRKASDKGKSRKWGAYTSEADEFLWVRGNKANDQKCVEAELMDLADDIAYAVHDVEDFYRAGLIPLDRLRNSDSEINDFLDEVFKRWKAQGRDSKYSKQELANALGGLLRWVPFKRPYGGTRAERAALRTFTSGLIATYVTSAHLVMPPEHGPTTRPGERTKVLIDAALEKEIAVLKELTWHYVILEPRMVARAVGQRTIVREIFGKVLEFPDLLPKPYAEQLAKETDRAGTGKRKGEAALYRVVVDYIASMNDLQALRLYHRITGISLGSILETLAT